MSILNLFGKKDVSSDIIKSSPFRITTDMVPYKLYANRKSSAVLFIKLKNMTPETLLTSVVMELPGQISFDEVGISKQKELRIGNMNPNEEREVKVELFGGLGTEKGGYTMTLTAIAHYRDYGHVMNAVRKRSIINVV